MAGWGYPKGKGKTVNNVAYCSSRRDDLYFGSTYLTGERRRIKKKINNSSAVTIFDFMEGTVVSQVKGTRGWHEGRRVLLGEVRPDLRLPYHDYDQKRHDDKTISITDVYRHICGLGKFGPGTLREFSIFSHAYWNGPIMLNTFEADPPYKSSDSRDPDDKDARMKDFEHPKKNLSDPEGCLAITNYRRALYAVLKKTKDSDRVRYVDSNDKTVEKTVGEVKRDLADALKDNYIYALAKFLGVPVWGAPPGLGASLKERTVGNTNAKRYYMYISPDERRSYFGWWKRNLGVKRDRSNYFAYK